MTAAAPGLHGSILVSDAPICCLLTNKLANWRSPTVHVVVNPVDEHLEPRAAGFISTGIDRAVAESMLTTRPVRDRTLGHDDATSTFLGTRMGNDETGSAGTRPLQEKSSATVLSTHSIEQGEGT